MHEEVIRRRSLLQRGFRVFLRGTARALQLLGILWALPLSLAGLLIALPVLLRGGHVLRPSGRTPCLVVHGRLADTLLRHHPFGPMSAMAIGHIVIASQVGLSRRILVHELVHVRQAALWGPLFPLAYLASSAWALLRGRDAYWHNLFEVAARNAEQHG